MFIHFLSPCLPLLFFFYVIQLYSRKRNVFINPHVIFFLYFHVKQYNLMKKTGSQNPQSLFTLKNSELHNATLVSYMTN